MKNNKVWKKISGTLLVATMVATMIPATAYADVVKQTDGKWVNSVDGALVGNTVAKNTANNTWWAIDENGYVDFTFNGFYPKNDENQTWWYCKNGKVDFTTTGVTKGIIFGEEGSYWSYVQTGRVMTDATETIRPNSAGWWYLDEDAVVDFTYTGFAKYKEGWWYCQKGKVNFNLNGVLKLYDDGDYDWVYVKNGKLQQGTPTLAKNTANNTWWYIDEYGEVDFNYDSDEYEYGLAKYNGSYWYIKGGKVDFSYTGLCWDENLGGKLYYIKNGKMDTSFTGLVKIAGSGEKYGGSSDWVYVKNGQVVTTDLPTLVKNAGYWWYVDETGFVDFSYTGLCKYNNIYWAVCDGKVNFNYQGLMENTKGFWYCKAGKVDFTANGVYKDTNSGKWVYIVKGQYVMSETLAKNPINGTWWYVDKDGIVDFTYTGLFAYNGDSWYVKKGQVQFVTGVYTIDGQECRIVDGKFAGYGSVANVIFKRVKDTDTERAVAYAEDKDGNLQWNFLTSEYTAAELNQTTEIGARGNYYYLVEGGRVVCLSKLSGDIIWKTSAGYSVGASNCFCFDSAGNLYVTGYNGPDLTKINTATGAIMYQVKDYSSNLMWPCKISVNSSGTITLVFESGKNNKGGTIYINSATGKIK